MKLWINVSISSINLNYTIWLSTINKSYPILYVEI